MSLEAPIAFSRRSKHLGIIAGWGPDTSVLLIKELIRYAREINPGELPKFSVDFTGCPLEWAETIINGSDKTEELILELLNGSIEKLISIGANVLILPCSTLHFLAPRFRIPSGGNVTFLHMIDCVAEEVLSRMKKEEEDTSKKKIGLLATTHTISRRLYHDRCEGKLVEVVVPNQSIQDKLVEEIISYVQIGTTTETTAPLFSSAFKEFNEKGVKYVVFGCTDLQGMAEECSVLSSPLAKELIFIDSNATLAKYAAECCVNKDDSWKQKVSC